MLTSHLIRSGAGDDELTQSPERLWRFGSAPPVRVQPTRLKGTGTRLPPGPWEGRLYMKNAPVQEPDMHRCSSIGH